VSMYDMNIFNNSKNSLMLNQRPGRLINAINVTIVSNRHKHSFLQWCHLLTATD